MSEMTTAEMVSDIHEAIAWDSAISDVVLEAIAARLSALDKVAKAAGVLLAREFDCDDTIETKERKYLLHDVSAALKEAGYGK